MTILTFSKFILLFLFYAKTVSLTVNIIYHKEKFSFFNNLKRRYFIDQLKFKLNYTITNVRHP